MTLRQVVAVALIGLVTASCGGNNPPSAAPQAPSQSALPGSSAGKQATSSAKATASTVADSQEDRPVPPADAQWTIYCRTITGPNHIAESRRLRDDLRKISDLRGWYLVHGNNETTLYHGYYRAFDDPNDPATRRAQTELDSIKKLKDLSDRPLFRHAMFVGINVSDPEAPAEWNLLNSGGYYTLEIGIYTGSIERKQAAVDAVREARARGIEAYYHHGDNASSVCIGAWGPEAAETAAPVVNDAVDKPVVIATDRPTGRLAEGLQRLKESKQAITVTPNFIPKDPTMIEMMQRFPHRYINGELYYTTTRDPKTGQVKRTPDPSYIVLVPKRPQNILTQGSDIGSTPSQATQRPDYNTAIYGQPQQQPQKRPAGKLRSLND